MLDLSFLGPEFAQSSLNQFIALGFDAWESTRLKIAKLISEKNPQLKYYPAKSCILKLPVDIGDYTDFFTSEVHATNLGKMFRPDMPPLTPQFKTMPTAYHGRASSVIVSGTKIKRPSGQILLNNQTSPIYSPTQKLDIEVELGFIIGMGNNLGEPISIKNAHKHIFGVVIVNDWSARDIQRWEYVPLGPFLGKNFGTSISPWVMPMSALKDFWVDADPQDPIPLDYLFENKFKLLDIKLEVLIKSKNMKNYVTISNTNSRYLYWSPNQMVAHHTVNGCNLRTGDLLATGTISGPNADQYGSLIELSWNGKNAIKLNDQESRFFLEDGDSVIIRGRCEKSGMVLELGEVEGTII